MRPKFKIPLPDPFQSSERIKDSVAAAYSYTLNPRNTEVQWYPPYTETFSVLVDFFTPIGTLSAAQQFNMCLSGAALDALELQDAPAQTDSDEDDYDGFSDAEELEEGADALDEGADEHEADRGEHDPFAFGQG